jgi:hypothetical protein
MVLSKVASGLVSEKQRDKLATAKALAKQQATASPVSGQ